MHLALLALGIGPGDEVIVPDITWVATANVVTYVGATPIFADIQPDTWCLDPISFEQKVTPRTKAVIPVHLYGHPAPMDEILQIAKRYRLYVIEDAAPSLGAEYKGIKTGTFGDFAAFSFQGAKLAVTGEGGMLLVNNTSLLDKVRKIWDQGRVPGTFWIDSVGYKYKMSNLQAAIGLAQLERIEELVEAKRRIFSWYEANLHDCASISIQREADWARSIYWMSNIMVHESAKVSRDELIRFLASNDIQSRPVFPAISQYPIWIDRQDPNPAAKAVAQKALNLPSGVCLRKSEVDYICECVLTAFRF